MAAAKQRTRPKRTPPPQASAATFAPLRSSFRSSRRAGCSGSLGGIFAGGLALVYFTMVLLFWQGQWQILFHPDRIDKPVPTTASLPLQNIAFDTTGTGRPLLNGWYIPAATGARYENETILYLHSMQTGSLADAMPELTTLYQLGINLFAFDYRGFGSSDFVHPSEATTSADVEAAWQYLVETRHIAARSIVIDGAGLAGSLAASAASAHPDAAGLVLDAPEENARTLLARDPRSRWMPVRLLAHDVFDPTTMLSHVKNPKLMLLTDTAARPYADAAS